MAKRKVSRIKEYNGYEKEFLDMDTATRLDWANGLCVLAIGRGDLRGALFNIIDRAWRTGFKVANGDIKKDMQP